MLFSLPCSGRCPVGSPVPLIAIHRIRPRAVCRTFGPALRYSLDSRSGGTANRLASRRSGGPALATYGLLSRIFLRRSFSDGCLPGRESVCPVRH